MANSSLLGAAALVDVEVHKAGALIAVAEHIETMAPMVGVAGASAGFLSVCAWRVPTSDANPIETTAAGDYSSVAGTANASATAR